MLIELLRFTAVSGVCAFFDLGIGLAALGLWGMPAYGAATYGWGGGVVSGYLLHRHWTFSHRRSSPSRRAFNLYFVNCLLILLIRWMVIALFKNTFNHAEATLVLAVIISFGANYFISRTFIFR